MIVQLSIAAFLAAVALPTLPDDELLPELTPKGQYLVLTEDDAASSSKCIGNPETPMCAVETVLACFVRASKNLCLIGMDESLVTEYGFGKPGPMIYRVVRREILTDRRFPWNPDLLPDHKFSKMDLQAGDIRIDILERRCPGEISFSACERVRVVPNIFIVRWERGRWTVVTWKDRHDQYYIWPEGQYSVLTEDDATSSSKCIGNPVTPLCAVETVLACLKREKSELCRTGMGLDRDFGRGGWSRFRDLNYRVMRTEVLTEDTLLKVPEEDPDRPGEMDMQAGDVRIDILERDCLVNVSLPSCDRSGDTTAYVVRAKGGRWAVITWGPVDERF